MKMKIALLCLFAAACAQNDLALDQSEQQALYNPYDTISWTGTSGSSYPVVEWSPTQAVRWPGSATNMQVFLRTGSLNMFGGVANFYVFVVGDGVRLDRVYRVRTGDYPQFRAALDLTMDQAEVPGSNRTYGINGSIYTGPKIGVGPAGEDPPSAIPGDYVTRILQSAAGIQAAALQAAEVTLTR